MKLACETCPWSTTFRHNEQTFVSCRNAQRVQGHEDWITPDYWCSLHPAAPKPIYEIHAESVHHKHPQGSGWEPVKLVMDQGGTLILWRRIIGYTKGGE